MKSVIVTFLTINWYNVSVISKRLSDEQVYCLPI